jgi:hypothetical protein
VPGALLPKELFSAAIREGDAAPRIEASSTMDTFGVSWDLDVWRTEQIDR